MDASGLKIYPPKENREEAGRSEKIVAHPA